MYIHSYQIHNVLNDYRKQLSHGPGGNAGKNPPTMKATDRISISTDGQRQSIMDKISSEIVARITQAGPDNEFEAALADRLSATRPEQGDPVPGDPPDFTYTVIDEHNRKSTNTLTIQGFGPSSEGTEFKAGVYNGRNRTPETE